MRERAPERAEASHSGFDPARLSRCKISKKIDYVKKLTVNFR